MFCSSWACSQPSLSNSRYDDAIQRAVKTYWLDIPDWKLWKAQLYQESQLQPEVCSKSGACGLAQFMPKSWDDITKQMGRTGLSAKEAGPAIEAGAFYMMKLRKAWAANGKRLSPERHRLAEASYNAGIGNIIKAQQACSGAFVYADIIQCLPQITGNKSKETITYVNRIATWRALLGN